MDKNSCVNTFISL